MGLGKFRQYRDRLRDESGQSIILISVVILSFLMFFQFAVSTGLLINAKISVQTAADAAAYAGAAVQARQMNAISFLNYDMRRQYKKFLFRYAFVGSMGNAISSIPQDSTLDSVFDKREATRGPPPGLIPRPINVPVVCIPLTENLQANDNCLNVSLPNTIDAIVGNTAGGTQSLNSITDALISNLKNIQALQNNLCQGQGQLNLFTTLSWLFRTDLSDTTIKDILTQLYTAQATLNGTGAQPDVGKIVTNLAPLLSGLGLYPRNIINQLRIATLQGFINEPKAIGMTQDIANSFRTSNTAESKERSLQAFQSALANLNDGVFDSSLVSMDEMQPDSMLTLEPVLSDFNVYIQHMNQTGTSDANHDPICASTIDSFPAIGAPVGVRLASAPRVEYAVHLKAFIKPHGLLYLPNSEPLELDAFAGAKPFGGRIGPQALSPNTMVKVIQRQPINGASAIDCPSELDCRIPYLSVNDQAKTSMFSMNYMTALRAFAQPDHKTYSAPGIVQAQRYAMAPTIPEVGHYNIIPPPLAAMNNQYIPYATDDKSTIYSFYAPVYAAGGADVATVVQTFLDKMFQKTQVNVGDNPFGIDKVSLRQLLLDRITAYINGTLVSSLPGTTENGETLTFAAIQLPMPSDLQPSDKKLWLTKSAEVLSSWGPGAVSGYSPRFGYSVKFVTMRDLASQGVASDSDDLSTVNH